MVTSDRGPGRLAGSEQPQIRTAGVLIAIQPAGVPDEAGCQAKLFTSSGIWSYWQLGAASLPVVLITWAVGFGFNQGGDGRVAT